MSKSWIFTQPFFLWNSYLFYNFLSPYIDKPANFMEIGSYEGMSSIWMMHVILTHPQAYLTCIDSWENLEEIEKHFWINVKHFSQNKLNVIKGKSEDILENYMGDFDFVYIDACHKGMSPYNDAVNSWKMLVTGGIMAFDDYNWKQYNVKPAINRFLDEYKDQLEILHKDYQVWIKKK